MSSEIEWCKRIDLFDIRVFENPSNWTWRSPSRQHYNLWIALEGEGIFQRNHQSVPFRAGSLFLIHPDDSIDAASSGRAQLTNFAAHFRINDDALIPQTLFQSHLTASTQSNRWIPPFCRFLSEAFYLDREINQPILLQGFRLLVLSLQQAHRQKKLEVTESKLLGIVERMRQNPAATYSLDTLAAEMKLSISQFSRRFKTFTGQTPVNFVINERIALADSLLQETELSIEAIATRLGYRDVYFFSRQFRRFRGIPPSATRKERHSQPNRKT